MITKGKIKLIMWIMVGRRWTMMRSFIIPIDKWSEEYFEGRGDQQPGRARLRGKHPVRKEQRRKCTSCAYNKKPNSNKWLDTRKNDYTVEKDILEVWSL